jgi:hypothetical protein
MKKIGSSLNKKKDFSKEISKWNLPPFEDLDSTTSNVIFKVDVKHYDTVLNLIKPEKTQKNIWMHYNKLLPDKIEYKFLQEHQPKYPIYIISLNRYQKERCYTIRHLEKMNIKYRLCVMTHERDLYKQSLDENKFTNCIFCLFTLFIYFCFNFLFSSSYIAIFSASRTFI